MTRARTRREEEMRGGGVYSEQECRAKLGVGEVSVDLVRLLKQWGFHRPCGEVSTVSVAQVVSIVCMVSSSTVLSIVCMVSAVEVERA